MASIAISQEPDRIVRPHEVTKMVGYTNQHLLRLEKVGKFPRRFLIRDGGRAVGWRLSTIQEWIDGREATSKPQAA